MKKGKAKGKAKGLKKQDQNQEQKGTYVAFVECNLHA
jgi:hypothetical protein